MAQEIEAWCASCGEPVAGDARFCSSCGTEQPILGAYESDQLPPVHDPGVLPAEKDAEGAGRPRRGAFLALAATVVVVFGAAGGTVSYLIFVKDDRASDSGSDRRASRGSRGPAPGSGSGGQSPVEDDWPDSRAGFTVALAAMGGPTGAEQIAARGRRQGLRPGVLRSRDYGSLTSDYWFVFHGTFDTFESARRDVMRARRAGFDDAYVTYVSREEPVSTDDSSPDREGELRSQRRTGYTVRVPGDWQLVADEVSFGSRLRSKWRHPSNERVSLLVDRTPRPPRSPLASARSVRDATRGLNGYEETSFRRTTIRGRPAVEWRYRLASAMKVDYFVNACGAGYAILGVAPVGEFTRYEARFKQVTEGLAPNC